MRGKEAFVDRGRQMTHKCYNLYSTVKILICDGRELRFIPTPPVFYTPLGGSPLEYCHNVWYGKTRMM